eukprot:469272-Rhodomonas_salina.1
MANDITRWSSMLIQTTWMPVSHDSWLRYLINLRFGVRSSVLIPTHRMPLSESANAINGPQLGSHGVDPASVKRDLERFTLLPACAIAVRCLGLTQRLVVLRQRRKSNWQRHKPT